MAFIVIIVTAVVVFAGWFTYMKNNMATAVPQTNILFELKSQGALNVSQSGRKINIAPWSLSVFNDGSGLLKCTPVKNAVSPCKTTVYGAKTFAYADLSQQLPSIDHGYLLNCDAMHNPAPASLVYDGHTIHDIDCFEQSRYNVLARSLYTVYQLIAKSFINNLAP